MVFLLEWFLLHPSMRYGGYVLIALPLIIITSLMIDKLNIDNKKKKITYFNVFVCFYFGFFRKKY